MTNVKVGTLWFLFAITTTAISGCGNPPDGRPPLAEVHGVITLDGSLFEAAFVTFIPEIGRPSVGISDAEGKYTLKYLEKVSGAAIGHHQVRVFTFSGGEEGSSVKEQFPAKYNTATTLTAEVTSGENTINFDLKSK